MPNQSAVEPVCADLPYAELPYAELQVTSNFTFLEGGSHPEELVMRAAELGHRAVAVTDRNSLAGVVRAHMAAKRAGIQFLVGARIDLRSGRSLLLFPTDKAAYARLSRLLTLGRRRAEKGDCALYESDLTGYAEGQIAVALPPPEPLAGPVEGPVKGGCDPGSARHPILRQAQDEGSCLNIENTPHPEPHPPHPEPHPPRPEPHPPRPEPHPPRPGSPPLRAGPRSPRPEPHPPHPEPVEGGDAARRRPCLKPSAHPEAPAELASTDAPWAGFGGFLEQIVSIYGADSTYLAAHCLYRGDDAARLGRLAGLAGAHGIPLVATNDVHYHVPERRPLQDVLTCIREHVTLDAAGFRLFANAERHLKPAAEMARLFAGSPVAPLWRDAVARTAEIAERIDFSLDELRYTYPVDPAPDGRTPQEELARLTWLGAKERYPGGVPARVRATVEHELDLIGQLDYAPYFLTVHDIVRFARSKNILCQGRGSAANSAVCYCLGITAVDPGQLDLLFERFVSAERNEPPDIDVDFEHERREEVIQYVYEKYGRDRAGLAATVISYRARSAIREVGKVVGLSEDMVDRLAKTVWGWSSEGIDDDYIRQAGLDPDDPTLRMAVALAAELIGFPRHLSQHVGGFVITRGPLSELAPIENAAMEDRTVVEWDKDDLDALGILKIDILALGMLTCIRKGFDLIARHYGRSYNLATVPPEDPAVYDMLCRADSVGVFQVESRAQMSMLPRLRPRDFYDLVVEVAIVRPGPIQGDMVHPYLRRRNGEEKVSFPKKELEDVLGKTLGVPLFQEQAMRIAIVAAGFTPSEADQLRRAMATFRKTGKIHGFNAKMVEGMVERGYDRDFAERCFKQIEGFGEYGFPESHAASFALLVYVSAWMKCHYPAVFACALLNSQPMGFYAPAQIVRDAREHGVEILPPDVNRSEWDNTLEPGSDGRMALRLGFRQIKGLREAHMEALVAARGNGYRDPRGLWQKTGLAPRVLERLAQADAFASMGLSRREALWAVRPLGPKPLPLFAATGEDEQGEEPETALPLATDGEEVVEDYATVRLTLRDHPLALLRGSLSNGLSSRATSPSPLEGEGRVRGSAAKPRQPNKVRASRGPPPHPNPPPQGGREMATGGLGGWDVTQNAELDRVAPGERVEVAGLVLIRQRPGTAKGVVFMTLEDETGVCNVIVWPHVLEKYRPVVMGARLVHVTGELQREGIVTHIVAARLIDLSGLLDELADPDAHRAGIATLPPFANTVARADEVARQSRDPREAKRDPRRDRLLTQMYPSRDFH